MRVSLNTKQQYTTYKEKVINKVPTVQTSSQLSIRHNTALRPCGRWAPEHSKRETWCRVNIRTCRRYQYP